MLLLSNDNFTTDMKTFYDFSAISLRPEKIDNAIAALL